MDKAKEVAKHGWHPKGKDGGRESWRGDYKPINSVVCPPFSKSNRPNQRPDLDMLQASKFGHGRPTARNYTAALNYNSRPLSSLQDPDSFGPPPKNINFHGDAAFPVSPGTRSLTQSPLAATRTSQNRATQQGVTQGKPAPPPTPFRADRTAVIPSTLPKPPVRSATFSADNDPPASSNRAPKPNLPPRLPPRQNSHPLESAPHDPPPPYSPPAQTESSNLTVDTQSETANRGAIDRLGAVGVRVPAFGIVGTQSSSEASESPGATVPNSNINGLQSRLANLSTGHESQSSTSTPPNASGGTTFAQKQAAFKTASAFRNDPSSVSAADAKAAASTANNFRERHGEQVAQGWKLGAGLNQKYGIANRLNSAASPQIASSSPAPSSPPHTNGSATTGSGINRKPPPPPVPHGSKPR